MEIISICSHALWAAFLLLACGTVQYSVGASPGEDEATVLVVMGGEGEIPFDTAHALDMTGQMRDCTALEPLPMRMYNGVGIKSLDNEAMYCGGTAYFGEGNEHEANWCFAYDYYGFDEKWTDGGNMLEVRLNARVVQQGENQFWVTGGVGTDGEGKSGTERLTEESSGFGEAPDLPYAVHGHCLVALDEHFTILTGGVGDPGNGSFYVHDWIKNQWVRYPDMPEPLENHNCGIYRHHTDGPELVLAGGQNGETGLTQAKTFIFNFSHEEWRYGPDLPLALRNAGQVPMGESFLLVGGFSPAQGYLTQILEYDGYQEDWHERQERLIGEGRSNPGLVWLVEDINYIHCA